MNLKTDLSPRSQAATLPLKDLKTEPEDFQFRAYEFAEHHVQDLVKAIKAGCELDPLTVWQRSSNDFVILNGHHRHEAYSRCDFSGPVSVVIHQCDEAAAKLLALDESAKTKLPMTNTEKSDAAWCLVCSEHDFSKAQISKATGISDSTIAKMRRIMKQIHEEDWDIPSSWYAAMRIAKRGNNNEWDDEMKSLMIDAAARELDDQIGKALSRAGRKWPEAVAQVLERRLNKQSLEYVLDELRPDTEDWDDLPF